MCLRCGHNLHIRADGACITCGCPQEVLKWDLPVQTEEKPTSDPLPFDDSDKDHSL